MEGGVRRAAHTIEGCAGNLSGVRLGILVKEMEQAAAAGQLEVTHDNTIRREREINALIDELQNLVTVAQ